jgi:hypothetical protein
MIATFQGEVWIQISCVVVSVCSFRFDCGKRSQERTEGRRYKKMRIFASHVRAVWSEHWPDRRRCSLGRRGGTISLTGSCFLGLLLSGCAMQAPSPQGLPESTANVGPDLALPSQFYGCWEGKFESFDSVTPLSFAGHFVSRAIPVTYQFCYQPKPDGGAQLDLTKVEIDGKEGTITHFDNRVTAVDNQHLTGSLENHATMVSVSKFLWVLPVSSQQDIFAHEDLAMKAEDIVFVQGKQRVQINDEDIVDVTFHADFHRVPGVLGK